MLLKYIRIYISASSDRCFRAGVHALAMHRGILVLTVGLVCCLKSDRQACQGQGVLPATLLEGG